MTSPLHRKRQIIRDLNQWYNKFISSETLVNDFITHDPVQFPRFFATGRKYKKADVEIAAFLAATIAWGRRDLIIRSAQRMFTLMQPGPAAFVMSGDYRKLKGRTGGPRTSGSRGSSLHRTFFEDDLLYFCKGFQHCYAKYGSLEKLFASAGAGGPVSKMHGSPPDIWQGTSLFREEMAAANGRYSKHIANPGTPDSGTGSACKRINLALRWLVRKGPVDIGLWKNISPSALHIPLDVHVARTARRIGLLTRKSNDKKAVIELTEKLRSFCPEDPVKYDFALFGIGIGNSKTLDNT